MSPLQRDAISPELLNPPAGYSKELIGIIIHGKKTFPTLIVDYKFCIKVMAIEIIYTPQVSNLKQLPTSLENDKDITSNLMKIILIVKSTR